MNNHLSLFGRFLLTLAMLAGVYQQAAADTLLLHALSDLDSSFYEFPSEGYFRMNEYATTQPTNQNFRNISDPSTQYGQGFDGFPNERNFRFGSLEYDTTGVVGGTGIAPITGLTLGIYRDPLDPTYENTRRWTPNTLLVDDDDPDSDPFGGTVKLVNGELVDVNLVADVQMELSGVGSEDVGYYPGHFIVTGRNFEFQAEGAPVMTTFFGTIPFHLRWDFSGVVAGIGLETGDYDANGRVDGNDFLLWQQTLGTSPSPAGSGADGDASGTVDGGDLTVWKNNFGPGAVAAAQTVPEPAAWAAALVGACCVAVGRRRSFIRSEG